MRASVEGGTDNSCADHLLVLKRNKGEEEKQFEETEDKCGELSEQDRTTVSLRGLRGQRDESIENEPLCKQPQTISQNEASLWHKDHYYFSF